MEPPIGMVETSKSTVRIVKLSKKIPKMLNDSLRFVGSWGFWLENKYGGNLEKIPKFREKL